ncbi:MAG TPA: exosortase system-associated protein, TIGR04073 family [Candidatus Omnitrophota bacterium]|nr:exosortase system-associated protein, TIGR04073 family [Candidatus Omnitrophota bacterium]
MKKHFLILSFLMMLSAFASAGEYVEDIATKFGRGVENFVTSPAEIPCTVESEMHKGDRIIRFFSGLGKGTVYFLRRAIVGTTEVVTFMIPMERTMPQVCKEEPAGVIG